MEKSFINIEKKSENPYLIPFLLTHPDLTQLDFLLNRLKGVHHLEWGVISKNEQGEIRQTFPHPYLVFIPACRFEWDARVLPIFVFQKIFLKWAKQDILPMIITPLSLTLLEPFLVLKQNPFSEVAFLPQEALFTSKSVQPHLSPSWAEELNLEIITYLR